MYFAQKRSSNMKMPELSRTRQRGDSEQSISYNSDPISEESQSSKSPSSHSSSSISESEISPFLYLGPVGKKRKIIRDKAAMAQSYKKATIKDEPLDLCFVDHHENDDHHHTDDHSDHSDHSDHDHHENENHSGHSSNFLMSRFFPYGRQPYDGLYNGFAQNGGQFSPGDHSLDHFDSRSSISASSCPASPIFSACSTQSNMTTSIDVCSSLSMISRSSISPHYADGPNGLKKKFKCPDCSKEFTQLRNYRYHRSKHEGTKQFACTCPICGKTFNDKGYISSHLKIHRNAKEYICEVCGKGFNQRVAYNMHVRIHTGYKPHKCTYCPKAFSRKMLLRQHLRTHTGERPYQCEVCGKAFADRSNMLLHQRLHTGERPFKCHVCEKSFSKKHHLKTHLNQHAGIKPYECEKCHARFSQSSNMKTHFRKCKGLVHFSPSSVMGFQSVLSAGHQGSFGQPTYLPHFDNGGSGAKFSQNFRNFPPQQNPLFPSASSSSNSSIPNFATAFQNHNPIFNYLPSSSSRSLAPQNSNFINNQSSQNHHQNHQKNLTSSPPPPTLNIHHHHQPSSTTTTTTSLSSTRISSTIGDSQSNSNHSQNFSTFLKPQHTNSNDMSSSKYYYNQGQRTTSNGYISISNTLAESNQYPNKNIKLGGFLREYFQHPKVQVINVIET